METKNSNFSLVFEPITSADKLELDHRLYDWYQTHTWARRGWGGGGGGVQLGGGVISGRAGSRFRGNFTKFGLVTRRISTASSNGLRILYEYNNDRGNYV